jgi:hypothetical protein
MQARKTHEQQKRMLERKPDVPDHRRTEADMQRASAEAPARVPRRTRRQSDFPVSRRGVNQESAHNKHNDPPRGASKP